MRVVLPFNLLDHIAFIHTCLGFVWTKSSSSVDISFLVFRLTLASLASSLLTLYTVTGVATWIHAGRRSLSLTNTRRTLDAAGIPLLFSSASSLV